MTRQIVYVVAMLSAILAGLTESARQIGLRLPDEPVLVYATNGAAASRIEMLALQRATTVRITRGTGQGDYDPAWSPDGDQIAYQSSIDGKMDIISLDPYNHRQRNLTDTADTSESYPTWSPDGTRIAYTATVLNQPQIFLMDAAGRAAQLLNAASQLTTTAMASPSWSPDGTRIAWWGAHEFSGIYITSLADGSVELLTDDPGMTPVWSPDGRTIAYVSARDYNYEVYLIDVETGAMRNLSQHPAGDLTPAWSPDGHALALASNRDGDYDIYVIMVDSGLTYRATSDPSDQFSPTWQP